MSEKTVKIIIETNNRDLIRSLWSDKDRLGICVEEKMLKSLKSNALRTVIIMVAAPIGINLFSSWLYDKLKDNSNQQTVINGNHISGQNISIGEVHQIICSPYNNKHNEP